ncbi:MAG: efflux RND transporter periplasmic adaptor subunit [Caulobacteraceae bacterium]
MTKRWAILAALALGLAACHRPGADPAPVQRQPREMTVVRVEMRPIAGGLVTSGLLTPRNQVAISPDLSGYRVSKLYVDEGDWVKAGQPLAEMDGSILKAQLAQQEALAAEQKATAAQREAEAARVKGLGSNVIAVEQVQGRRFAAASALAAAKAQEAAVDEMKTRLDHLVVRAPVSGQIIQRNVDLGDISGAGTTPWFVMAEGGQIELYADISETDFAQVKPGMRAVVTLANDKQVDGVVRLVSPRVNTQTRLGTVRIALPVRPDIRAGGYARATFVDLSRAVPSLPETAIRYDANGASVMVVGPDGKVSQQTVQIGARGGGDVELLTGPPPGTVVVAKAASQLLPGDHIRPYWPPAGSAP